MYLREKNIIQPSTKYLNITVQVLLTYQVNWDKIGYSMLEDLKQRDVKRDLLNIEEAL